MSLPRLTEILEKAKVFYAPLFCEGDREVLGVSDSCYYESIPNTFVGNVDQSVLQDADHNIRIKGLTIVAQGNQGTVKIIRESDGECLLPLYVENFTRSTTSSNLNVPLNKGDTLKVVTEGRTTTSETFVGITFVRGAE